MPNFFQVLLGVPVPYTTMPNFFETVALAIVVEILFLIEGTKSKKDWNGKRGALANALYIKGVGVGLERGNVHE
jgi:hypothetical protein